MRLLFSTLTGTFRNTASFWYISHGLC